MSVRVEKRGPVTTIVLSRPDVRNAVDTATAAALATAFRDFERDPDASVGVLFGEGGVFSAGADLSAFAGGERDALSAEGDGPMGPTRMCFDKPVIAAVAGYAVAGGLELALLCDLRVVERDAVFGVFCRRFGVPLIDGGTVRLPRMIGLSRALDMILTGRAVRADEALAMGLANRVVENGMARGEAEKLAEELARFPQTTMRGDRASAHLSMGLSFAEAMAKEFSIGMDSLASGEAKRGAAAFVRGRGRHGSSV